MFFKLRIPCPWTARACLLHPDRTCSSHLCVGTAGSLPVAPELCSVLSGLGSPRLAARDSTGNSLPPADSRRAVHVAPSLLAPSLTLHFLQTPEKCTISVVRFGSRLRPLPVCPRLAVLQHPFIIRNPGGQLPTFPSGLSSSSGGRALLLCAQLSPVSCAQQRRFEMDRRTRSKARTRSISGKADRYPPERQPWWFACCWNAEDSRWPGSHPRSLCSISDVSQAPENRAERRPPACQSLPTSSVSLR